MWDSDKAWRRTSSGRKSVHFFDRRERCVWQRTNENIKKSKTNLKFLIFRRFWRFIDSPALIDLCFKRKSRWSVFFHAKWSVCCHGVETLFQTFLTRDFFADCVTVKYFALIFWGSEVICDDAFDLSWKWMFSFQEFDYNHTYGDQLFSSDEEKCHHAVL